MVALTPVRLVIVLVGGRRQFVAEIEKLQIGFFLRAGGIGAGSAAHSRTVNDLNQPGVSSHARYPATRVAAEIVQAVFS